MYNDPPRYFLVSYRVMSNSEYTDLTILQQGGRNDDFIGASSLKEVSERNQ